MFIDLNFPLLMRRAHRAMEHSKTDPTFGVDCVLFSAIAAESFPNDMAQMLSIFSKAEELPKELVAAHQMLVQMEEERVQLGAKYRFLYYILAGQSFEEGKSPYQDLAFLIRLRNELVHPKVALIGYDAHRNGGRDATSRRILGELDSRGLLTDLGKRSQQPWRKLLESHAVAGWALRTVGAIIVAIYDAVPESKFKRGYLAGPLAQCEL